MVCYLVPSLSSLNCSELQCPHTSNSSTMSNVGTEWKVEETVTRGGCAESSGQQEGQSRMDGRKG